MVEQLEISLEASDLARLILDASADTEPPHILTDRLGLSLTRARRGITAVRLTGVRLMHPDPKDNRYIGVVMEESLALTEEERSALRADPRRSVDGSKVHRVEFSFGLVSRDAQVASGLAPGFDLVARRGRPLEFSPSSNHTVVDAAGRAQILADFKTAAARRRPQPSA